MAPSLADEDVPLPDASNYTADISEAQTIPADEVALYDRQIRLWGMEAQARMRNAHILVITIRALANEVAKNLVLAGIGSLTILDPGTVTEVDLGSQFIIGEEDVGMERAEAAVAGLRRLNPRVAVHADTEDPKDKGRAYYEKFDVVIATELDIDNLTRINSITRECGRPFYAAATFGLYGYVFADLIKHEFVIEREKPNVKTELRKESRTRSVTAVREKKEGEKTVEFVTKEEVYSPLAEVVTCQIDKTWRLRRRKTVSPVLPAVKALWEFQQKHKRLPGTERGDSADFTRLITASNRQLGLPEELVKASFISSFVANATSEISPVAAVLGGILAQDVINYLGKREQPLQNLLVFDGETSTAPILALHPQEEEEE